MLSVPPLAQDIEGIKFLAHRLSAAQMEVVRLRQQGNSRRECAALINRTPHAVKKRFWRARKRILSSMPNSSRDHYSGGLFHRPRIVIKAHQQINFSDLS